MYVRSTEKAGWEFLIMETKDLTEGHNSKRTTTLVVDLANALELVQLSVVW